MKLQNDNNNIAKMTIDKRQIRDSFNSSANRPGSMVQ